MSFFRGLHGYYYWVGCRIKESPWNNLFTWLNLLLITCIWILGWRSAGCWLNSEWQLCLVNTQLIQYQSEVNDISTHSRRPFAASRHVESSHSTITDGWMSLVLEGNCRNNMSLDIIHELPSRWFLCKLTIIWVYFFLMWRRKSCRIKSSTEKQNTLHLPSQHF